MFQLDSDLISKLLIAKVNKKVLDFSQNHRGTWVVSLLLVPFQYDILPLKLPRYIKLSKIGSLYLKPSFHAHKNGK